MNPDLYTQHWSLSRTRLQDANAAVAIVTFPAAAAAAGRCSAILRSDLLIELQGDFLSLTLPATGCDSSFKTEFN